MTVHDVPQDVQAVLEARQRFKEAAQDLREIQRSQEKLDATRRNAENRHRTALALLNEAQDAYVRLYGKDALNAIGKEEPCTTP